MIERTRSEGKYSRSSVNTVELHPLPLQALFDSAGRVLMDRLVLVQRRRNARRLHLQVNLVAQLVLVSEEGLRGAGVRVILTRVVASHVREPQVSLGVERHPRVVDRLQLPLLALQHPVHFRAGVAVWRRASQLERLALVRRDHRLRPVGLLEGVQLSLSDEHRVGRGGSPLVLGEALVLAEVLVSRLADHERAPTGLLRDTVVVAGVFEWLPVLDPSVPVLEERKC